jgi:hypothetical protein
MTKIELINKLSGLPGEIHFAEMAIFGAQDGVTKAKDILSVKEADLYSEGVIDGKNAEIRTAQLRQLTTPERNEIAKAENALSMARIAFNQLQNYFTAYRAIAGMLKGAE